MTIRLRQGIMGKEEDIRLDQKVRAAWMYYIAGLNQSEIASQLGTSRPVVQRMIAAAKEEGIVSIGLHHPVANCLDYAQLLQEKYRLERREHAGQRLFRLLPADGPLSAG